MVDVSVRRGVAAAGGIAAASDVGRAGVAGRGEDCRLAGARVARDSDRRPPLPERIMSCRRALRRSRRSASVSTTATGAATGVRATVVTSRTAPDERVETDAALVATPTAKRAQTRPPIAKVDCRLLKASPDWRH